MLRQQAGEAFLHDLFEVDGLRHDLILVRIELAQRKQIINLSTEIPRFAAHGRKVLCRCGRILDHTFLQRLRGRLDVG